MITCSTFLTNGRTGNILFRFASLIGIAEKYNKKLLLPYWPHAKYFDSHFPEMPENESSESFVEIKESTFHYVPEWPPIKEYERTDIHGYLQSEKYWDHYEGLVRDQFKFKPEFIAECINKLSRIAFSKPTIAISIRRGDYVDNPNYELMPITYYILALFEHFPDWQERNLVIFSDDIPYCRVHFDCLPNVFFSENNSDIEDLCLMSQCDEFIISNSTFSWWGAYLSNSKKVVRPNYLFNGFLKSRNDFKDFYPERWITFDHKKQNGEHKRIDLKNTCFTIPVSYDHEDRKENLDLCILMLKKSFDTNIMVYEQGNEQIDKRFGYLAEGLEKENPAEHLVEDYQYKNYNDKFHRTKMLNEMALKTKATFVFNWDADIIIPPLQIWCSVQQLINGADMVYPYAWAFARLPRLQWIDRLKHSQDIGIIGDTRFNGMHPGDAVSLGGAVGFRKLSFILGGMENENFISYGAEDVEREERFRKLGFKIERSLGQNLYHLNHFVGLNSNRTNQYFLTNQIELDKICQMTKEELQEYINTWEWTK